MQLLKVIINNEGKIANDGRGVISLVEDEGTSLLDNARLMQSTKFTPTKQERIEEKESYSPQTNM